MNRTREDGAKMPVFVARAKRQQLAPDREIPRDRGHRRDIDTDMVPDSDEQRKRDRKLEEDLELIKQQYLGTKKAKKHVLKPSEKMKMRFRFDWENTEDTSRDAEKVTEARLLFGRGFLGGIDKREQKSGAGNDRHWSEKKVEEMSGRDWRIFREDFNISYKGSRVPPPIRSWSESKLSDALLNAVEDAGYKTPSAIQMAAIPLGLQQRDVIGIATTGSGKTAAFVLPMLSYISKLPKATAEGGPYAVVMAPTRELAQQIKDWTVKLSRYLREIRVVLVVGGQPIQEQSTMLGRGCEVVIATPGRLLECLEEHFVVLNQCNYVVLDEADRMIEQGFEEQIIRVLDRIPSSNLKPNENEDEDEHLELDRIYQTTYMFSATMPPAVERLARKYLRNHVVVNVGAARSESHLITQNVVWVNENSEKLKQLRRLLDGLADETAIVFVNERKIADAVFKSLCKYYRVTALHAGMSQQQRVTSLKGFRTKKYNVMVATNVLGRGIDIPNIAHVINYDMPTNIEDYTHRIGRTGRAGKTGIATTFLTRYDTSVFYDLKQMLIQSKSCVPRELAKVRAPDFKPADLDGCMRHLPISLL